MRRWILTVALATSAMTGTALAAPAANPADAALAELWVAPKSGEEVSRRCEANLAATAAARTRLEAMPLDAPALDLVRAYDDLYLLSASSAYTEPNLIKETHPDPAVRAAAEQCLQKASALITEIGLSRPIFERLQAAEKQGVPADLRYSVSRQIGNYRRIGVDRDEATRRRVAEIQNEITAASIEFDRNIAAETRTVAARPEELAGLPSDYVAAHPPGEDGMVRIGMAYPEVFPVLRYASNEGLRRRVFAAFQNRAHPANEAVLNRIIALRAELAGLLGFDSYAAYDLESRMARDPERARKFLDEIAAAARPAGERDAARMLARLQRDDPSVTKLGDWSSGYATTLIRKEEYAVDPQAVRQYFRYDRVRDGIFRLTEDLFGVEIRPVALETWAPGVNAYEMVEGGKAIGRFYLDMHPREGKFSHAAMFPVRIGLKDRTLPSAALVTNFSDGLMEHNEVVTFLHEFGHLLHWLFAGNREWAMQNFSELENDVTEAPSQLLEEWVWDEETLGRFALNDAGERIPADLVARMNAGRRFAEGFGTLRQLGFSAVSLDYYSAPPPAGGLADAYRRSYDGYALGGDPEGTHPYAAFGHLTGYGAAYYTYTWSKALASDLLGEFRRAGLRDPATARRYRETILAPGGSESMNVLARNFLGRDWSADAYRRELEGAQPAD